MRHPRSGEMCRRRYLRKLNSLAFLRGPMRGQEYGQGREWNCYQSLDWHEGEEDHRKGPDSTTRLSMP